MAALFVSFITSGLFENVRAQNGIAVGVIVKVVTGSNDRLRVRKAPGLQSMVTDYLDNGTLMRVVGGPEFADNYQWWELDGNDKHGWAVSNFLQLAEGVAITSEPPDITPSLTSSAEHNAEPDNENISIVDRGSLADTYGFSKMCFFNFQIPSLQNPEWINADFTVTAGTVKKANDLLIRTGYQSQFHDNASAEDVKAQLVDKEVFFFFGHGLNSGIIFHNEKCEYSKLSITKNSPTRLPNLKLALLLACSTGKDISANDNILMGFRTIGAKKAIGFRRDMNALEMHSFSDLFWKSTLEDGMEAGDAARKAASEARFLFLHRIDPSDLVILGTEDVYLQPKNTDINVPIQKWLDDLKKKWDDFFHDLQRQMVEKLQQDIQVLLSQFFDKLTEMMQQCCTAPLGFLAVGSFPVILRKWYKRVKK